MFFTSLISYYQIYYYSLLYAVHILFLVKDGDTTRNMNIQKCLKLQSTYAAIIPLNFFVFTLE